MLKIYDDKSPFLRMICPDVSMPYTQEDKDTLKQMTEYLKMSQDDKYALDNHIQAGIGLAAPQIGIAKRMFAIYLIDGDKTFQFGLINPKIIRTSVKKCFLRGGEGCLSVPIKHQGNVARYYKSVFTGYDALTDKEVTISAYGYLSIAMQHENDHLDGILYYDHISSNNPLWVEPGAIEI